MREKFCAVSVLVDDGCPDCSPVCSCRAVCTLNKVLEVWELHRAHLKANILDALAVVQQLGVSPSHQIPTSINCAFTLQNIEQSIREQLQEKGESFCWDEGNVRVVLDSVERYTVDFPHGVIENIFNCIQVVLGTKNGVFHDITYYHYLIHELESSLRSHVLLLQPIAPDIILDSDDVLHPFTFSTRAA